MGAAAAPMLVTGTALSAYGNYMAGQSAQEAADEKARQLGIHAQEARAAGIMAGEEELRKTKLMQSRILALAGASGAGAMDPTIVNLTAQTEAEGHLAAKMRRYNAESEARGMEMQASALRKEGEDYASAGRIRAAGSLLSMASVFK